MIIVVKNSCEEKQLGNLVEWVKDLGLDVHVSRGESSTVLGLVGDTSKVDMDLISSLDIVEQVQRVQEPYKNANRKFHPEDTVVDVSGVKFGGKKFQVIAGPCSVESEKQIIEVAEAVKKAGATMLRGGAFKPRTSPYAFQGLKDTGIELLLKAKKETGLPPGTTALRAAELAKAFMPVVLTDITEEILEDAAEILVLGTTCECVAVTHYNGKPVGDGRPGPIADRLRHLLHDALVTGGVPFLE